MAKRKPTAAEQAATDLAKARSLIYCCATLKVTPTLDECRIIAKALPALRPALRELEQEAADCRERGGDLGEELADNLQDAHDAVRLAERAAVLVREAGRG